MADIFDTIQPDAPSNGDIFDQVASMPDPVHQFDNLPVNERPSVTLNDGSHPTYGAPEQPAPAMSSFFRGIMRNSPIEQMKTAEYEYGNQDKMPKVIPGEDMSSFQNRTNEALQPREKELAKQGTLSQFQLPMDAALAMSGAAAPFKTAKALAMFTGLDKATNAVSLNPDKIQDPNLRDVAQVAKFGAEGAAISKFAPRPSDLAGGPTAVTQEEHNNIVSKLASTMRNVLNPDKGDINKVEVKSGKSIDDAMENAVRKGLVIGKDSTGTKLDTSAARGALEQHNAPIYDQINQQLASNPDKQFNLDDIATRAKNSFDNPNSPLYEKNALLANAAKSKIQNEIDAEIIRHGQKSTVDGKVAYDPNVDGATLNQIKQGMWGKSYNPLDPNANDAARQIGFVAKDAIEKAYPESDIKDLNQQLGDNLQLTKLLERAHGRVIQAGKIGKYAAQGVGALTGHASHIPGGEIAGAWLASKASALMNDPTRITSGIADKINNLRIVNPDTPNTTRPGVVTPEVVNPSAPVARSFNPVGQTALPPGVSGALPAPKDVPYSPNLHTDLTPGGIQMPNEKSGAPIEVPPLSRKNRAVYTPGAEKSVINFDKFGNVPQPPATAQSPFNPLTQSGQGADANMPVHPAVKAAALAGAVGLGSMLAPGQAQASQVKEPERLELPSQQYTMKEEGFRGMPYLDTKGIKTVGYGFAQNGMAWKYVPQAVKDGKRAMTQPEATATFNKVYPMAVSAAAKFSGERWGSLSPYQQKALSDMAYQLGSGKLNGFHRLQAAIHGGNFHTAAREILDSDYADQAPNRANRNAALITRM